MSALFEDDDLFVDETGSQFGEDPPPSTSRPTRQTRNISGSTASSYSTDFSRMPPPPPRPSVKPAPDVISRLGYDDLVHNEVFLRSQHKIKDLEHTISMMVCELVEARRVPKAIPTPPPTAPLLSTSLAPSDSVSHEPAGDIGIHPPSGSATSRSLTRPSRLPLEVLWTLEDCKNDPLVGFTESNKSRPPIHRAIRHEDGSIITVSQWKLIRASACSTARSTLADLFSSDPRAAGWPRKKKYFKTYFPQEWELALAQLEISAPLLKLCAGNWKADLTLGTVLSNGLILPTQPSSPPSSQPSLPKPSHSLSGSSSVPVQSGRQTHVGSKSKRVRDLSPPLQPRKKAKGVGHRDGSKNSGTGVPSSQPPPSSPAFLNMTRDAASSQSRAPSGASLKDINVRPSATNLIKIVTHDFPKLLGAADLLRALHEVTNLEVSEPSNDIIALLNRLDTADPDTPDVDEDDSNENWGHAQFTAGGLTIRSALVDWEAVGSTSTAFKLIAAAIRTCKVARALCAVRGRSATAYLADNYLELLFERLEHCWKGAQPPAASNLSSTDPVPSGGAELSPTIRPERATSKPRTEPAASKSRAKPAASKSSRTEHTSKSLHAEPPTKRTTLARAAKGNRGATDDQDDSEPASQGAKTTPLGDSSESEEGSDDGGQDLRALRVEELVAWIKTHKLSGKCRTKDEAIHTILDAPISKQPTKDDVTSVINKRASKKSHKRAL